MNHTKPIAIVCGGSSGIGLATVKLLAKEQLTYNIDIKPSVEEVSNSKTILCDLSNPKQLDMVFKNLLDSSITVDKFFYSAGIHYNGYLEDTPDEKYDKLMNTNLKGMFKSLKHILPNMKSHKNGSIVLMSSEQSIIGRPRNPIYALSKGAISQLARSLAIDNAPFNIRVNSISPGTVFTSMYKKAVNKASDRTGIPVSAIYQEDAASIPLQRLASPEEIALSVYFLLSDNSSYITGTNLTVDGGATIE